MKIEELLALQEKYRFYCEAWEEKIYKAGFAATKSDREIQKEEKQVLSLIDAAIKNYEYRNKYMRTYMKDYMRKKRGARNEK